jgi:hypothetical protein
MRLRFIAIDTGKDGCPTLYAAEDRESYVVQGWRVSDPTARGVRLRDGDTCVEVPKRLLTHLESPGDAVTITPPYVATEKGTYIVWGPEILDAETLGQMDVPGHETAVEVARDEMADLAREIT